MSHIGIQISLANRAEHKRLSSSASKRYLNSKLPSELFHQNKGLYIYECAIVKLVQMCLAVGRAGGHPFLESLELHLQNTFCVMP